MSDVSAQLSGRRILLVEDEYVLAEIIEEWLCQAGAEVVGPVPNVEQALKLIDTEVGGLDGAVLDMNLGRGETVYPVADRLNELGVPYLFATGDVPNGGVRALDGLAHRERTRLEKPILRDDLLKAVGELLARRSG